MQTGDAAEIFNPHQQNGLVAEASGTWIEYGIGRIGQMLGRDDRV